MSDPKKSIIVPNLQKIHSIDRELRAIKTRDFNPSFGKVFTEATGYTYFFPSKSQNPNSFNQVVYAKDSPIPGLTTGNIVVKVKKGFDADSIASTHSMDVAYEIAHLSLAYVKSRTDIGIFESLKLLQKDSRIESVELEVSFGEEVPK